MAGSNAYLNLSKLFQSEIRLGSISLPSNYPDDGSSPAAVLAREIYCSQALQSLTAILSMPLQLFLGHMCFNSALNGFIACHLTRRQPFLSIFQGISLDDASQRQFALIDRKIFLCFHRVVCSDYKAVFLNDPTAAAKATELHSAVLNNCSLMGFETAVRALSLVGDGNITHSSMILIKYAAGRTAFKAELWAYLDNCSDELDTIIRGRFKAAKPMTYRNMFNRKKNDTVAKPLSEIVAVLADTVTLWSTVLLAGSHSTDCKLTLHPLASIMCGNLTGFNHHGLKLSIWLMQLYEVLLPDILATSLADQSSSLPKIAEIVSHLRLRIMASLKALLGLTNRQLEKLSPSELDLLMFSDWQMENCCSWLDWLQRVANNLHVDKFDNTDTQTHGGAFLADFLTVNAAAVRVLMNSILGDDADQLELHLQQFGDLQGFVTDRAVAAAAAVTAHSRAKVTASASAGSERHISFREESVQPIAPANVDEGLETLKAMFPDYGKVFLMSCLQAFDFDVERATDGILTDNLNPALLKLDRKAEAISLGKTSLKKQLSEDQEFAAIQLQRIKAAEKDQLENARVIAAEYNDDFDEEYFNVESAVGNVDSHSEIVSEEAQKVKKHHHPHKQQPVINWEVKMKDTKRLNKLIMAEEEEQLFWESMKNTNHLRPVLPPKRDEEDSESANTADKKGPKAKPGPNRQNKPVESGNKGGKAGEQTKPVPVPSSSHGRADKKDKDGSEETTETTTDAKVPYKSRKDRGSRTHFHSGGSKLR